jgi:hypothetical protein
MRKQAPPTKTMREVLDGPFAEWMGDGDWTPWYSFLMALRGEPMTKSERRIFRECTGRTTRPTKPFTEAWVAVGRKGRKSATAAMLAVYMAVYMKWDIAPGETCRVLVLALTKDQAKIVRDFCEAILESRPGLARLIKGRDSESITLTNGIVISCVANSFRSIRGPAVICAILEENAFWYSQDTSSANPDIEIFRAIQPAMLTKPGATIIGISSPYARRGLLWEKHRKHYGVDDSKVLVWQAPTEIMHPGVNADVIQDAYDDDPVSAAAEYGAQFRSDVETFLSIEVVEACCDEGIYERAPASHLYRAFVDPSGGSGDSFTVAIAHRQGKNRILDAVREFVPPFSPEAVVAEICKLLKLYRIGSVEGDAYAGEWPREQFRKHGVAYKVAELHKSEIYRDALPLFNSGRARLLDVPALKRQLSHLERKTSRAGRDSIDHPRGAKDDVANAACGALQMFGGAKSHDFTFAWAVQDDRHHDDPPREVHLIEKGYQRRPAECPQRRAVEMVELKPNPNVSYSSDWSRKRRF